MAVRTVTYESVLRGIANLGGVKRDQLLTDHATLLFEYINRRVRMGWEFIFWPEFTRVEKRFFREGLWSPGTYSFGDIVFEDTEGGYFEMTTAGTTTEQPSSTATDWTEAGEFDTYVPLAQTAKTPAVNQTEIGYVKAIYQRDPRTNQEEGPISHRVTNNGVGPIGDSLDFIFIEFRERVSDMSGKVEFDPTDTYKVGDWIYYESPTLDGEAYEVTTATTAGQDPEDTPGSFSKFDFPYILSEYVKRGALSDWLGAGGGGTALGDTTSSVQLASFNEARAKEALEDEAYKYFNQQTIYTSYVLRTA